MVLKPQDVLIILKLTVRREQDWSYASIANELAMSPSEVHAGIRRATVGRLFSEPDRRPVITNLEEFVVHGVKYAFPVVRGTRTRGIVTAYAALPLNKTIVQEDALPPVWPDPQGETLGISFSPLYKSVPQAAARDRKLYELLTIVDAFREGRVRERRIAVEELHRRLHTQVEE